MTFQHFLFFSDTVMKRILGLVLSYLSLSQAFDTSVRTRTHIAKL